jgi:hypothetical protein
MSMEIQFLAWDWHKKCIGSKLKNAITTKLIKAYFFRSCCNDFVLA